MSDKNRLAWSLRVEKWLQLLYDVETGEIAARIEVEDHWTQVYIFSYSGILGPESKTFVSPDKAIEHVETIVKKLGFEIIDIDKEHERVLLHT